jgi:hypothetical protein
LQDFKELLSSLSLDRKQQTAGRKAA